MTPKGCACKMIDIIFEEGSRQPGVGKDAIDDALNGFIIGDEVKQACTLRCCVFQMPHINIEAAAIKEESTVTGGFAPVAVVDVSEPEF